MKNLRIITIGNFKFQINDGDINNLEFHQSSEILNRDLKEMVIDGNSIRYELKEDNIVTTYWTAPVDRTMDLIEYISDLFNIQVEVISFYLFRLPHIVSKMIIDSMNAYEQLLISLCSRRAFSVIKSLRRKSKDFIMKVHNDRVFILEGAEQLVSTQLVQDSKRREIVKVNGRPTSFSCNAWKPSIQTYWEEPVVGTKELIEHMTSLFGVQVNSVLISNNSGTELLNWVLRRQRTIVMLQVSFSDSTEKQFEPEDLKNLIMECAAAKIQLTIQHSKPFEIQDLHKRFKVFQSLRGTWITVDNLMTLDCICIVIKEKRFTCAEMNRFIKHWVNGGSPRLKVFQVKLTEENDEALFEGIDAQWNIEKVCVSESRHNGFFEVFRSDGRTAGFQIYFPFFWFGVWPIDNRNLFELGVF
uniref:FBA_2 domain-containing protein n=2 Tax=Caenorhabditis tropicalis TaxID=1561998 RepID=A0A1I7U1T1_9PELO